jgi:hypothetical protein
MHVTILGKRYKVRFTWLKENAGDCDDPTRPRKEIRICTGLGEQKELETVLHEVLHAADWHKTEEWVEQVARDQTRLLWRLGYRKTKLDDQSTK